MTVPDAQFSRRGRHKLSQPGSTGWTNSHRIEAGLSPDKSTKQVGRKPVTAFIDTAKAAFPSFERFDGWRGREDRILLRNAFADCGISTYCGLAAIWLAERDDSHYWEADFYVPRTARARHWLAQVSGRFIDLFGELRLVGRFSNGEAIFERSRSNCDTGS
jgi:hypothetical protein